MPDSEIECALERCCCILGSDVSPVTRGEEQFCSERCADQRGCDHADCNCGDFPEEEPPDL
jgi:hypothetical protein